jgi:hypothetical protein
MTTCFDPATFIVSRRSALEENGKQEESGWDIRYYALPELRQMMTEIGFELKGVWGDYDSSSYGVESNRLITCFCVAGT